MRFSISLLALLAASPAFAEDYLVRADVAEALVYASEAQVVRRAELELEAGSHRILFPASYLDMPPNVTVSDGSIGEVQPIRGFQIDEGALDTDAQAAARQALEDAETAFAAAQVAVDAAIGTARAAELQQAYLQSIVRGGDNGASMPDDAETLVAILATLGGEMARAETALHEARQVQNERRETLADAQVALVEAQQAMAELRPLHGQADVWAVTIELEAAATVSVDIEDRDEAAWAPFYDLHLNSETGALTIERYIGIQTGRGWEDVAVTLSTADPWRGRAPSPANPTRASIFEPVPLSRASAGLTQMDSLAGELAAAPVIEPVVLVEESRIGVMVEGLSLSYAYPDPVTIGPGGQVFLPFDELGLEADLINRAVPRRDSTAFLIADITNDTGEPILPGDARFFRDGALLGDGYLNFMPAGANAELPFGPLDHIQLTWTDLSRDTGDRGVFATSNIEDRRVMVSAENLSGEAIEVQFLYATPFSEQEDLEIEIGSSRAPDDTAWENRRGVYAWNLELDAGEEIDITLEFELDWPDDMELDWRP